MWRVALPRWLPRARRGLGQHRPHLQLSPAAGQLGRAGGRLSQAAPLRRGAAGGAGAA
ncbi:hypothetical protein RLOC_00001462 [Lonchura striata]|uniref:Uncharacterized protein n=1 Tax=Lonchura striata TaxID=40157 RepID=A0A218UBF2_9PASE|nr:hypothetical protein RLOC_00001462 [Lonchura striata domestica]